MNPTPPWQAQPLQRALAALAAGQLGHALLLTGPEQLGQDALARALAQRLLCTTAQGAAPACGECRACTQTRVIDQRPHCTVAKADAPACGQCRGCIQALVSRHPDLRVVGLEFNDKTDKLRSEIAVEQVRQLSEWVALSAQQGGAQVVIVSPADLLNRNAANALLKTLEEPSPGRYLLLVSARPHRLPATIRSRCQQLALRLPERGDAMAWLQAQGHREAEAATALDAARGNPGLAAAWLRDGTLALRKEVIDALTRIVTAQINPFELANQWQAETNLAQRLAIAADFAASLSAQIATGQAEAKLAHADNHRLSAWFDQANQTRELLSTTVRSDLPLIGLLAGWRDVFGGG